MGHFNLYSHFLENLEIQLQCTAEFEPKALRQLFFVSIVFITAENMSCAHSRQYMLSLSEIHEVLFIIDEMN